MYTRSQIFYHAKKPEQSVLVALALNYPNQIDAKWSFSHHLIRQGTTETLMHGYITALHHKIPDMAVKFLTMAEAILEIRPGNV